MRAVLRLSHAVSSARFLVQQRLMACVRARVQIRRPNNYDINVSLMLGPTEPDPTMDVSSLDIVKTVVQDSPHKLFIGGLPCDWSEDQVRSLESTLGFCWTLWRL